MLLRLLLHLKLNCRLNLLAKMGSSSESQIFMPPEDVRGMTEFDATKFTKSVMIPCIEVPLRLIGRIVGAQPIRELSLRRCCQFKHIIDGDDSQSKLMLFDPDKIAKDTNAEGSIRSTVKQIIDLDVTIKHRSFTLSYHDWDVKRCLKAVLPEELDFSGHTQAGHILHLNLREELMPYKFVIGRILLDKIKYARTVVNKLDQISSEFRFFDLELLAGEPNYVATVSENGYKYKLDFSKVFWNSRLNNEHTRIVEYISKQKRKAILFDVFAGVGPFVVPAMFLKNMLRIYANDLNPTSIEFLNENLKLNKADESRITVYNLDGAEFIRTVLPVAYEKHCSTNPKEPVDFYILMNLPALAVSFLPAFKSSLSSLSTIEGQIDCEFIVHCYMFVKATEDQPESWFEQQAINAVMKQIQFDEVKILSVVYVRNVANRKNMYCVKFKLPVEYLTTATSTNGQDLNKQEYVVAEKRRKLET